MNKKIKYLLLYILLIPNLAYADINLGFDKLTGINIGQQKNPKVVISKVVIILLSFLGIFATVILLLGGFKWMTSQGNKDKVDEAKNLIKNGIIGLVIIFSAYAISAFVMRSAEDSTLLSPPIPDGDE